MVAGRRALLDTITRVGAVGAQVCLDMKFVGRHVQRGAGGGLAVVLVPFE